MWQTSKAKESFDTSLSLAPDDVSILTAVGTFYVGLKELQHASHLFEKVSAKEELLCVYSGWL